ncbi:hypothetical protein HYDPIDRAFT_108628 [Hydnomerulius pinastri MD-312]|nr:hypothetical protein HYDPIDRAFT_108628 [Hydnomerulius pinastri MD-312]
MANSAAFDVSTTSTAQALDNGTAGITAETPTVDPEATASQSMDNYTGTADSDTMEVDRAAAKGRNDRLRQLSKTFGHIPGVNVFTSWESRLQCSNAAVHRSVMAGICGNKDEGAFSIVLSSSYADDEDGGETIIYTGVGGRKRWTDAIPPKRIRVGPQVFNQTWEDSGNKALVVSQSTQNPVRVVRGYTGVSKYAPVEGYRYDGLYTVVSHWMDKGRENGLDICRFRLQRIPGQPLIPLRPPRPSPPPPVRKRKGRPPSSRDGPASAPPALGSPTTLGMEASTSGERQSRHSAEPTGATGWECDLTMADEPLLAPPRKIRKTDNRAESPVAGTSNEPPPGTPINQTVSSPVEPSTSLLLEPAPTRYRWDSKSRKMVRARDSATPNRGNAEEGRNEGEEDADEDDTMGADEAEEEDIKPSVLERMSTESTQFSVLHRASRSVSRSQSVIVPIKKRESSSPEPSPGRELSIVKPEPEDDEDTQSRLSREISRDIIDALSG